jgi:glycosyltransferase involved in cell wall biosynthesis
VTWPLRTGRAVALFSPGWPPGHVSNGIVTYVGHLRPALERLGVETSVLTSHRVAPTGSPAVDLSALRRPRARELALRALSKLPRFRAPGLRLGWVVAQAARELEARSGLDLVEMEESFGAAWYTQRALDVPVVVRLHGPRFLNGAALGLQADEEFRRIEEQERICITDAIGVTAPSRDVLDRTREHYGLPLADARVIHYPGPIIPAERRWQFEGCDPKSILFVGRFDRHKGGDVMIDAFREVTTTIPEAELHFVGLDRGFRDDRGRTHDLPGYLDANLPRETRAKVHVHGELDAGQIETLRRRAHVTVVPSRYETFGFTVAEALAYACPTVAADSGGIPEVLLDGQTGLLFRPGNPSDLAAKIRILFAHPGRAAALGLEGALDTARRFNPDTIARASLDYYEALWARHPRTLLRAGLSRIAFEATAFG